MRSPPLCRTLSDSVGGGGAGCDGGDGSCSVILRRFTAASSADGLAEVTAKGEGEREAAGRFKAVDVLLLVVVVVTLVEAVAAATAAAAVGNR